MENKESIFHELETPSLSVLNPVLTLFAPHGEHLPYQE